MNLKFLPYILIVIFASILGWVGTQDKAQEEQSAEEYCRMVSMYKDSNGAYGWPDYQNAYDSWCNKTEVANVAK